MHSLHVLPYLMGKMELFDNFGTYSKIWNLTISFCCLFSLSFSVIYLSGISTTTQNTTPIWKTASGYINISTSDRFSCVTLYLISVITIWIYFVNIFIFFSLYQIFFNVVFWKLISTCIYVLISMHLIHTVSYMQIYILHNHKSPSLVMITHFFPGEE